MLGCVYISPGQQVIKSCLIESRSPDFASVWFYGMMRFSYSWSRTQKLRFHLGSLWKRYMWVRDSRVIWETGGNFSTLVGKDCNLGVIPALDIDWENLRTPCPFAMHVSVTEHSPSGRCSRSEFGNVWTQLIEVWYNGQTAVTACEAASPSPVAFSHPS